MSAIKIFAIVLIVAGILGLTYGGFSYTKNVQEVKVGPVDLSVKKQEMVNIPIGVGVGAIVIGVVLILATGKKI